LGPAQRPFKEQQATILPLLKGNCAIPGSLLTNEKEEIKPKREKCIHFQSSKTFCEFRKL
jgi:hypothetical protein